MTNGRLFGSGTMAVPAYDNLQRRSVRASLWARQPPLACDALIDQGRNRQCVAAGRPDRKPQSCPASLCRRHIRSDQVGACSCSIARPFLQIATIPEHIPDRGGAAETGLGCTRNGQETGAAWPLLTQLFRGPLAAGYTGWPKLPCSHSIIQGTNSGIAEGLAPPALKATT